MDKLFQALVGKGNRAMTFAGIGAILVAVGKFFQTGEVDLTSLGLGFSGIIGLLGRGAGTGSDAPAPAA